MEQLIQYLKRPFVKRMFVLLCIGLILFTVRSQMTLLLLTFIFVFIFNSLQKVISRWTRPYIKMKRKIIIIFLYLLLIGMFGLILYLYVPQIIDQVTNIILSVIAFFENGQEMPETNHALLSVIYENIEQLDITGYIRSESSAFLNFISTVGSIGLNTILALILSLFYLLEKDRIIQFLHGFRNSKIGWFYNELVYFSQKFSNSFGKVIQAQILIALINCLISTIFLAILRFPNLIGLSMLIFIFGLIPVAGVIISLFPLVIIAFSVGGFRYVVYVLLMVVVLHALEAYLLNPKLMSYQTKLPVFITFLILVVSEHFFGVWGLIVGIPVTTFFLDILEVKSNPSDKV